MRWKQVEERGIFFISAISTFFIVSLLFIIIATIAFLALPSLSPEFILTPESAMPGVGGAIANAIVGTLLLSFCATALATPLGICSAIYLARYAKKDLFTDAFRFIIEVLAGTPAIVLGILGLLILVVYLKPVTGGFSLISGSIALAILIVPVIERATEDAIDMMDLTLEEGSYALGATKWQTIRDIILPVTYPGIFTGVILAFGRAAEETAVVILTAGYTQFLPELAIKHNDKLLFGIKVYPFQDIIATLPYTVYHAFENSHVIARSDAFAAAIVLIAMMLFINFTAKAVLYFSTSWTLGKGGWCLHSITTTINGIPARFCRKPEAQPAVACNMEPSDKVREPIPDPVPVHEHHALTIEWPSLSPTPEQPVGPPTAPMKQEIFFEGPVGDPPEPGPATSGTVTQTTPSSGPEPVAAASAASALAEPASPSAPADPMPVPGIDERKIPSDHRPTVPPPWPRDSPSITDGFAGVILGCAGMAGFLGLVYGIRWYTKDATLEFGSILLVAALIATVAGVAVFQYVRLNRRRS